MSVDFIGAGWAFPLSTDATGSIALVVREREIEQAICLILGTSPGERPMRPEFGCSISDYVFGPANASTAGMIAYEVRRALDRWEPRIDVEDVQVSFDQVDLGTLYIDVRYVIRGFNDPRNLVFPFYVIPEDGRTEDGRTGDGRTGDGTQGLAAAVDAIAGAR
jgi:phage baseplate assembly protein W